MKRVRNDNVDRKVGYAGMDYVFPAMTTVEVSDDLADVAQHRHGHEGLLIVHEPVETAAPTTPEPPAEKKAPAKKKGSR